MNLAGQVVLITGGSRGLGLAMAEEFARQGAHVAICARDERELERAQAILFETGAQVMALPCDLTDRNQVLRMVKQVVEGFSEGLHAELAKEGIRVTTVAPGLLRTGSHVNTTIKGDKHQAEYTWFTLMDTLPITSISARRAARQIVDAARQGAPGDYHPGAASGALPRPLPRTDR